MFLEKWDFNLLQSKERSSELGLSGNWRIQYMNILFLNQICSLAKGFKVIWASMGLHCFQIPTYNLTISIIWTRALFLFWTCFQIFMYLSPFHIFLRRCNHVQEVCLHLWLKVWSPVSRVWQWGVESRCISFYLLGPHWISVLVFCYRKYSLRQQQKWSSTLASLLTSSLSLDKIFHLFWPSSFPYLKRGSIM